MGVQLIVIALGVAPEVLRFVGAIVWVLCQSPPVCFALRNDASAGSVLYSAFHPISEPPPGTRLVRFVNAAGMLPLSWLLDRESARRLVRFPSCGGMLPLSWLSYRE